MPKISFKNSTTASAVPASLSQGELAVNITDQKLYIGNASSVTTQIIGTVGIQDANTIAISGGTITGVTVGGTTASTVQSSSLTVGGQAITNIDNDTTLAGNSNTAIPTQNAVKTYLDNTLKGRLKNIYTFTSTGTYTKSGSDVNVLHVMVCGAGGGGTSYSIGGGAGGFS